MRPTLTTDRTPQRAVRIPIRRLDDSPAPEVEDAAAPFRVCAHLDEREQAVHDRVMRAGS